MVSLVVFKVAAMISLLLLTIVGAAAPLCLTQSRDALRKKILHHSSFFTGGVFLGAGMLHMLPDASKDLSAYYDFPVVFATATLGFLLIWSLDKLNFSQHQLDNSALLSVAAVAAQEQGGTMCFVSTRPVYSYGSFVRHKDQILQQARHHAQMITEGRSEGAEQDAATMEANGSGNGAGNHPVETWVETSQSRGPPSTGAGIDDNTPIAVYPITIVHVNKGEEGSAEDEQAHRGLIADAKQQLNTSAKSIIQSPSQCSHSHGHGSGNDERYARPRPSNGKNNSADVAQNTVRNHSSYQSVDQPLLAEEVISDEGNRDGANDESEHEHEQLHHHHIDIPQHALLPIFLATVFSIHSMIEGLALGAQRAVGGAALSLLIAIASHKLLEAVSVGSNFMKENVALKTSLPVLAIYCLMTPLGIGIGLAVDVVAGTGTSTVGDNDDLSWGLLVQSLLQAFAAGSFLYLAVHEITDEKCCASVKPSYQVGLFTTGIAAMALLAVWA